MRNKILNVTANYWCMIIFKSELNKKKLLFSELMFLFNLKLQVSIKQFLRDFVGSIFHEIYKGIYSFPYLISCGYDLYKLHFDFTPRHDILFLLYINVSTAPLL